MSLREESILTILIYPLDTLYIMGEFESLKQRLLDASPGINSQDLEERIREKKKKIGAGYLTDQGALFLVASDLGITISEPLSTTSSIRDLYVGARDVGLEARVMCISNPRQYTRKDGTPFHMRNMIIYDKDSSCSVTLWDEHAQDDILDTLKPGDSVKISGAYIKSDLGGGCVVNLGNDSEISAGPEMPEIPDIDDISKDVEDLEETDKNVVVTGILDGAVTTMNFTNSRGRPSQALRMRLKGKGGSSYKVVIWGQNDSGIPKMVPPAAETKLIGVRAKQSNAGLEVHGSESTTVQVHGKDSLSSLVLRVLTITIGDRSNGMLLCVDKSNMLYFVMDGASHRTACEPGDVIECMPTKVFGKSVTLEEDAFILKLDDDDSIPRLAQLRTRLSDTDIGGDYCIEVVVLQDPEIRDIQTRDGNSIQLLEMHVGDDTDQMWIKGWRNQSRLAGSYRAGDRLSITAVNARQGLEGRIDLVLTAYSTMSPLSDPKNP